MTFADLATQDPIGEIGSFDPTTGVGSVVAPNLAPGSYPVVATCVGPSLDLDVVEAGIRDNADFLRSLGFTDETCDINSPEFAALVEEPFGEGTDLFAFLEAIGPNIVQNIVEFDALGIQFFEILGQPPERIADLLEDIDALVAGGQLRANQARGITQHLTNALRSLEKGKLGPACAQLDAFIKVVNAKVKAGALDPAAAATLIAEAESIQEQLGCGVASPSGAFLE